MDSNSAAMNALLAKLYATFTAADVVTGKNSFAQDAFLTFCGPGIPVSADSFDFLKLASLGQLNAASGFAQVVNSIPKPIGFWTSAGDMVWKVYRDQIINQAIVNPIQISPQEQLQIDQANALLYTSVNGVDPITGAVTQTRVPSAALANYYVVQSAYTSALLTYNNKLIDVNAHPNDAAIVQDWALNGPVYEMQVRNTANAFDAIKGPIENAQATIAQITGRGDAVYFQNLRNTMSIGARKDGFGSEFYPSLFYPDQFWNSNSWSTFKFGESDIHTTSQDSSVSWGGGTSGSWGFWSWGASVQHNETDHADSSDTSGLSISVDLIQIPLVRPWFDPSLFLNRSWRFANPTQQVSNGLQPPATAGLLPLYPTSMIVARNLAVTMDMTSVHNAAHRSETQSSGSVGWGPFSLRGNYDKVSTSASHDYTSTDAGISCPGMQILAFICAVVPTCPNPDNALLMHLSHPLAAMVDPKSFRLL
jgi:hypothetical protein